MHRRRLPLSGAFDSDVRLQHLADVVGRRCQEGWQALLSIFRFASGPELVRGAARRARSIYSNVHHPAPSAPSSARVMSLRCCQSGLGSCWTAGPAAAQPGFMNVNLVALVIAVASWGLAFFARRQTGFAKKTAKENSNLKTCFLYTCRVEFNVPKHEEYARGHPRAVVCLVFSSRDPYSGTFILADKPDSGWYRVDSVLWAVSETHTLSTITLL